MVAVPLIFGELTADSYVDEVAADPRIDALRDKMKVVENETFTTDYFDPEKRAIGNAITIHFRDGTQTERVEIHYPIGHRRRRDEGIPVLVRKFRDAVNGHFRDDKAAAIISACDDQASLAAMPLNEFMELWAI